MSHQTTRRRLYPILLQLAQLSLLLGVSVVTARLLLAPTTVAAAAPLPELVVTFTDQANVVAEAARLTLDPGAVHPEPALHALRIRLTSASEITQALDQVSGLPNVRRIEQNVPVRAATVHAAAVPNDPSLGAQLDLSQISAEAGWDYETGSASVTIAIIDTGINGTHQDLAGRVAAGYNQLTGSDIPANANSDDNAHGTEVAGVIGATADNGVGISGLDWRARLMPIKVLDSSGSGTATDLANGIRYAADHGAAIINLSLGSLGDASVVDDAVSYAESHNVLVVAAAGNDGAATLEYPARTSGVLAVGSVDSHDQHAGFSNTGPELGLVAPGEGILTTTGTSDGSTSYSSASGTSLSAPLVSGAAGVILARHPGRSAAELRTALLNTADKVSGMNGASRTDAYGSGRLNLLQAVSTGSDFHASWAGQSAYPTLATGQSAQLEVSFVNTGESAWYRGTPLAVQLGTSHSHDHVLPFTREDVVTHQPSGWASPTRMLLEQDRVVPGQVGTFSFWISVPSGLAPGSYPIYVQPVSSAGSWLEDQGVSWTVKVPSVADQFQARWGGQSANPTLLPGQSANLAVAYLNTGSATWTPSTVHLQTSHPQDQTWPFTREDVVTHQPSGWASPSRMMLQESSVAPGQVGHFSFWISAPSGLSPGTYREYVQPVADGVVSFADLGVDWDITVQSLADTYHARWGGQNDNPTLAAGQSANLQVAFVNTGTSTWTPSTIHLATSHGQDHVLPFTREDVVTHQPSGWATPSRMLLQESSVAPGQTGHFSFWISVPTGLSAGQYPIYVQPVADGITWMEDQGVSWVVTVRSLTDGARRRRPSRTGR